MNSILTAAALFLGIAITVAMPSHGGAAVVACLLLSFIVGLPISQLKTERVFLLQIYVAGLLLRMLVGALIFYFDLHSFFGGDAISYDFLGATIVKVWEGELQYSIFQNMLGVFLNRNWGMIYIVGALYSVFGQNMLVVQFFSAVLGAATAPIIFLCAQHLFGNSRVSRFSAYFIAFYPSLVLWSSQGLKDGPLVFLLAVSMLATLKLAERLSLKYVVMLTGALFGIFTLRFYIFYMMVAAIVGSYIIGLGKLSPKRLVGQFIVMIVIGLAMSQLGVWQSAGKQFDDYGNLEAVQRSRLDLARSGQSGFGQDLDVSTTGGALSVIPIGLLYLLFAPFPWQLASLRQSITLPEMVVWWVSFPVLVMGLWFTLKYRMRQALPILIFTTMLTLAYSVFQGNVGTAYRQRSQLLIFYFIFVAVGYVLIKEKQEGREGQEAASGLEAQQPVLPAYGNVLPPEAELDWRLQENLEFARRRALSTERYQAYREFRACARASFMSHPATTEADFQRCWPKLRDELFKRQTYDMLARLPAPLHVLLRDGAEDAAREPRDKIVLRGKRERRRFE